MTSLSPHERALLEQATAAAKETRPWPSAAHTARAAAALDAALNRDHLRQQRAIPRIVAAAAVVIAGAASAGTALWLGGTPSVDAAPKAIGAPLARPIERTAAVPPATLVEPVASVDVVAAIPAPVVLPPRPRRAPRVSVLPPPPPAEVQDTVRRVAGDPGEAARRAAAAVVAGDRAAVATLHELARRDPASVDDAVSVLSAAGADDAFVARLRCELGLRYARNLTALEHCRAFGQRFPDDPAARPLAFGAGGLAEQLGELRAAVDEYSRVIVLSPIVGMTSTDALLARARVRMRLGELDEARADLRLFLHQAPSSALDADVRALAAALQP